MIYIGRLRARFRSLFVPHTLNPIVKGGSRCPARGRLVEKKEEGERAPSRPLRLAPHQRQPSENPRPSRHPRLQHRRCQTADSSAGLQSMCSILHSETGRRHRRRLILGTVRRRKSLIINVFCGRGPFGILLFHFGLGNAYSCCNEEAATLWTTPSIALTSHRSFLPRKRRQIEFPLIPA
jgi:hypothetical protein